MEVNRLDLEARKFEEDVRLKREEMEHNLLLHRDHVNLKKKELDAQLQSISFQMSKHQEEMKLRFMQYDLEKEKMKDK